MLFGSVLPAELTLVALTASAHCPSWLGSWLTRRRVAPRRPGRSWSSHSRRSAATWVGAVVAARAMFIDSHDLTAFTIIATTAGLIGVSPHGAWHGASASTPTPG